MGSAALLCVLSLLEAVAGSALDNGNIRTAVAAWLSDSAAAEAAYGHISTWETGGVTDMSYLFERKSSFNEDIGAWDTSGVKMMDGMFRSASAFNRDIGAWDPSGVRSMWQMFTRASSFNQDIGAWDTSGVKMMEMMFHNASAFNQDISGWAVHSVTTMNGMFYAASAFNQDPGWRVDDDVDLRYAFDVLWRDVGAQYWRLRRPAYG